MYNDCDYYCDLYKDVYIALQFLLDLLCYDVVINVLYCTQFYSYILIYIVYFRGKSVLCSLNCINMHKCILCVC